MDAWISFRPKGRIWTDGELGVVVVGEVLEVLVGSYFEGFGFAFVLRGS